MAFKATNKVNDSSRKRLGGKKSGDTTTVYTVQNGQPQATYQGPEAISYYPEKLCANVKNQIVSSKNTLSSLSGRKSRQK